MAITINTGVWGDSDAWDNAYSNNVYCPSFPADSGHPGDYPYSANTIWSGYANGNIDIDNFDDSVCPWAYGKNAPFLSGMWWIPNNDGTASLNPIYMHPETIEFKMSDIVDRPAFPAIFGINSDWQFMRPFVQKYREITDNVDDVETWIDNAGFGRGHGAYTFKPATNFNYNNICCCPRIIYISGVSGSYKTKAEIDALFTGEIGNKYYYFPYNDTEINIGSYTLYSADTNAREWLDTHYIVGISFDFYIVDSTISNPNYNSEFAFGLIENEPFPPLTDSGSFGDYYKHPFNLLGGGLSSAPTSKITIGGFQFFGMGSSNEQLYTKNDWINSAYRNSNGQYNPQPKLFLGVNGEKWTYYGYAAKQRSIQVQQCAPFWVWNGTIDELIEYTKRVAAFIGFPIITRANADTINKKTGWDGTGDNELLPVFDANGYTTGDYVSGSAAADKPNATWGADVWTKTDYTGTPQPPGDSNIYDDTNTSVLNPDYTKRNFKFNKGYLLTDAQVNTLAAKCFELVNGLTTAPDFVQELFTKLLSGNEPMDAIISLMFFPFNPAKYFITTPSSSNIMFGALDTGISAKEWENTIIELDMGGCTFYPENGDFRDFEPYTSCELYLPYIGSVPIDSQLYLGHEITVKYIVDLCTGAVDALIFRDGFRADKVSGNIGEQIAIHGIDQNDKLTAEQRAHVGYKQARNTQIQKTASAALTIAGGAAAIATGGAAAVLGGIAAGVTGGLKLSDALEGNAVERAKFDLEHIQTPYRTIGKASAATAYRDEQFCRLIIKRPKMLNSYNAANYAHTTGFATLKHDRLGNYTGLVVANNVDLSGFNATAEEKKAISNLLSKGVYL